MIDPRVLRDDPDRVRAAQAKRGLSDDVVDRALAADDRAARGDRRRSRRKRAEQKQLGKQIPQAQGEEKAALLARTKELAAEVKAAEAAQTEAEEAWRAALMDDPQPRRRRGARPAARTTSSCSRPSARRREFDFEPRDHVELGRMLGAIDIERGAKVSGSRFYFLTGVGAAARVRAGQHGDGPGPRRRLHPDDRRRRWSSRGRWRAPASSARPPTTSTGSRARTSTSSAPRRCRWRRTTPTRSSTRAALPLRYAAFSPCFRKEAGSHGKDTRGIFRVHWFDKVEMFVYTTLEESYAEHQRLLEWEKEFLDKLELAYRVIDVAAGDLGLSAQRKFDCEAWIPTPGPLPRADLDLQLHRLPDPAPRHPRPLRGRRDQAGRHAQRHARARSTAHDRRDPRDPPAGRRLGAGARGAAAVPRRARGPGAGHA